MNKRPGPLRLSPEQRARVSAATKLAMAAPEVRAKISARTKEGMAAAAANGREHLADLRAAWQSASPSTRKQFLSAILDPACVSEPREETGPIGLFSETRSDAAAEPSANLPKVSTMAPSVMSPAIGAVVNACTDDNWGWLP